MKIPCGTEQGYASHLKFSEIPCWDCAAAHSDRDRARRLYRRCLEGLEPAEVLSTRDREGLVAELVAERGWSDTAIAAHTRMTEYTTARIRTRLGLKPRLQPTERAA